MADTPWTGNQAQKLYLTSGQFTSTVKTSETVGAVDNASRGLSYDGTNSPWCGTQADKLYLTSGQFTSTIKDSEAVGGIDADPAGISWDGTNTPWCGNASNKLHLQSGQFTSTIKTSESVGGIETSLGGISYDGTNTPWTGNTDDKLYLQSGQFTSTLKTSEYVGGIDGIPTGISYDGTNTPWIGFGQKLYLQSGQFTSTLKTSQSVTAVDTQPRGIDTTDVNARLGAPSGDTTGDASITLPQLSVQGGSGATGSITLPLFTVLSLVGGEGDADITLPQFTVQGLSGVTSEITLPIFTVVAIGDGDIAGAITLPQLTISSTALIHVTASLTLPQLSISATALQGEIGNLNVALVTLSTSFIVLGRAYKGSPPDCAVMNTKNFAVSEYRDYAFNSYTRFNGANLAANQNGIYELDETSQDEGTYDIKAHIKSGEIDTYNGSIQRLRNAYLSYETDGDVQMVSRADEVATRKYYLTFQSAISGIRERRIKLERGIRNRVFDFKIENINGSSLEVDKLTILLEPIVSKRR